MLKTRQLTIAILLMITLGSILSISYIGLIHVTRAKKLRSIDYSARIVSGQKRYSCNEGDRITVSLTITNLGRKTWNRRGPNPCFLSYHLLESNRRVARFDNPRFPIPKDVKSGDVIQTNISLKSPLSQGKYFLEFDLLREGVAWFADNGSRTLNLFLLVTEKTWDDTDYPLTLSYGKYTKFSSNRQELNALYKLIRITLEKNQAVFNGKSGEVFGFSPGTNYPQIWLRDANTIIPASKCFYDIPYLNSWLEEHLSYQKENGSLEDWINFKGESDKNTTETDQESSAVQAAFQIYHLIGPDWLNKKINGRNIIDRLSMALQYVLNDRYDPKTGLITGAHTADWGDVDMIDADQNAIYVDEKTHWTADIYDQSMFYEACKNLAEMWRSLEEKGKAAAWDLTADKIRNSTNKWLWQEDPGYYRVHIHLGELKHDFDENGMFAHGGNTHAILSGIADQAQTMRIIQTALERQEIYQVSTISGTLLPPYPRGVFKHPLLDDPYEYQNGAQWDWFGGKLVYVMFQNGFSSWAKPKMFEIIEKNLNNYGFFEWDNREGAGLGSDYFCGSAGSLGKALFEGYFGILYTHTGLSLEPKLKEDSGKIHIYYPANDFFAAYDYKIDEAEQKVSFSFNSNFPGKGKVKILSPWKVQDKDLTLLLDGNRITYTLERIHEDVFIVFKTDFDNHTAEIIFAR